MKKILFMILALTILVISDSYSQFCDDNCTNPPWNIDRVDYPIPDDCSITIDYQYRIIRCNGIDYYQVKINWVAAVINESCGGLDFGPVLMETAWNKLLLDESNFNWPLIPNSLCRENLLAVGPACWEKVEVSIGPAGPGTYLYHCYDEPFCCKHKRICKSADGISLSINDLGYVPVTCTLDPGPVTGMPCFSVCE